MEVLSEFTDHNIDEHFEERDYGSGLIGLSVFFMCRDPSYNFKRRIRLSKKEKKLYMDIMLDLPTMKAASTEERKRVVAQRLYDEAPEVLSRYKIPDFNKDAFIADLREFIEGIGWI